MSLNESIEIVREALKSEIPSNKEFLALNELVSLAHIKIINAEIDKIKSDNKKSIKSLVETHLSLLKAPREEKISPENINFIPKVEKSQESINQKSENSVNNKYSKLELGLNDRLAFIKILFNGSTDDFEMVISALSTMETKEECNTFILKTIQPDYNWSGKEETIEKFISFANARFK